MSRNDINYTGAAWFFLVHAVGICGLWYAYQVAAWETVVFAIVYFFLCHLSITCGAHRLYAHRAYRATPAMQWVLLCLFSATVQAPMEWWIGKHRQHHHFTDQEGDPHSPAREGLFYAHMGWLLSKKGIKMPTNHMKVGGEDRHRVVWQRRNYWWLSVAMALGVPTIFAFLWGDMLGGLLVGGFARLFLQYHFTWVVNSAGHYVGTHVPGGGTATNNHFLGIITVGESYHANHHRNPTDWRLGPRWYDLDPGKWLIWTCMRVGLASPARMRTTS